MLYFTFKTKKTQELVSYPWSVGRSVPFGRDGALFQSIACCVEVEAFGEELEYIRRHFKNLPMCDDKLTMIWSGDFAQFIYHNL